MQTRLAAHGLLDIADKLDAGTRLELDDGVRLFACPDLLALGWLRVDMLRADDASALDREK